MPETMNPSSSDTVLACNRCKLALRAGSFVNPKPCLTGEIPQLTGDMPGHQFAICATECFYGIDKWLALRLEQPVGPGQPMLVTLRLGTCTTCPERNKCELGWHTLPEPRDYFAAAQGANPAPAPAAPSPPAKPAVPAPAPELEMGLLPKAGESQKDFVARMAKGGTFIDVNKFATNLPAQQLFGLQDPSWAPEKTRRVGAAAEGKDPAEQKEDV